MFYSFERIKSDVQFHLTFLTFEHYKTSGLNNFHYFFSNTIKKSNLIKKRNTKIFVANVQKQIVCHRVFEIHVESRYINSHVCLNEIM